MLYNQQTATTTETCLTWNGDICSEWEKITLTTYNWFDTLVLFLLPITMIIVIGFFKRK